MGCFDLLCLGCFDGLYEIKILVAWPIMLMGRRKFAPAGIKIGSQKNSCGLQSGPKIKFEKAKQAKRLQINGLLCKKTGQTMFWVCYKSANHVGLNRPYFNFMTFIDLSTQRHLICLHGMRQGFVTIH